MIRVPLSEDDLSTITDGCYTERIDLAQRLRKDPGVPCFIPNMVFCEDCGYFNPYEAEHGSPGECWRFPKHEVIDRPLAHQCGEGVRRIG